MKCKLLFFVFFLFGTLHSQESNGTFELHGEIEGENRGKVEIRFQGVKHHLLKTKLDDGKFVIKGQLVRPIRVTLKYKNTSSVTFYIENSKMKVSLYKDSFLNVYDTIRPEVRDGLSKTYVYNIKSIKGSTSEDLYRDYLQFKKDNNQDRNYRHLLFDYLNAQMDKHPNHVVYASIINQYCKRQNVLSYPQLVHLIDRIDMSQLHDFMRQSLLRNIRTLKDLSVGKPFPEKYITDHSGDERLLSEFYGKYTLIYFWSSTCTSCKTQNKILKRLYASYKSKGVNVIGISRDKYADKWKRAVEIEGLIWTNFKASEVFRDLHLYTIPYTFLIDENARIVGVNLTAREIESILEKNL